MKLKNISLAALLVAGVGVTGCSKKPVTEPEKNEGNKTVVDRNGTDSNKTGKVITNPSLYPDLNNTVSNPQEAMDKINAYAKDHLVNLEPTLQDYVTAGIVGVTEDNLAAVNDDIAKAEGEYADTVTEIHSIVAKINLAMRRIEKYADDGSRTEPTVEDYTTAGVLDVNANDIVGLNRRVDALKGVDVDTVAEIHTLVVEVTNAMAKIKAYAKDSANSPAPTVADYVNAGVNNVIAHNLAIMNENVAKGGEALDTTAEIQAVADELPANVFITDANLALDIVSIKDTKHGLYIPGEINGTVTVKVPYTVTSDAVVSLQACNQTKKIDANTTENNESDLNVTFSYPEQHLRGAGTFDATITVANGVYIAKQLGLGATPLEVASFTYDLDDNASDQGTFTIRIIPGVVDRNFDVETNGKKEHRFVYLPVTNPKTGRTWLNNNLGADYANVDSSDYNPSQQATASNDYLAYGSLFEWGRKADGHELNIWHSDTYGTKKYGHTQTKSNNPSNPLYIGGDYDWRVNLDNTLWASESSANNVCPVGYRLPLDPNRADDGENEWYREIQTWSSKNQSGAINSVLKLPMSGYNWNDAIKAIGYETSYWFGSAKGSMGKGMSFYRHKVHSNANNAKTYGFNVRCIKDQTPAERSDSILLEIANEQSNHKSVITIAQLRAITPTLENINDDYESSYRTYIANADSNFFSSPATTREVQRMIDAANLNLQKVGSYNTAGFAIGVALSSDGTKAYVADEANGLVILNISNPSHPIKIGSYNTAGYARVVTLSSNGTKAYVADDDNGLVIVNISDPAHPTKLGSYNTAGVAWDVALSNDGTKAYVADEGNGLVILNISNPSHPTKIGSYNTAGYSKGITLSNDGTKAYIADDHVGLVIINISDPAHPTKLGTYNTSGLTIGVTLSSDGSKAYVADWSNGLVIVDISDPAHPTKLGSYNTAGYSQTVTLSSDGTKAYVADEENGLVIVDISDPAHPTKFRLYDIAGLTLDVTLSSDGSKAYIADAENGLVIVGGIK